MARLLLSPRAARDLEEIGDYIARDNPTRAVTFITELQDHCRRLLVAPRAYAPRNDLGPGIRIAVHGRYLIMFRASGDDLRVERIVHSARHLPKVRPG